MCGDHEFKVSVALTLRQVKSKVVHFTAKQVAIKRSLLAKQENTKKHVSQQKRALLRYCTNAVVNQVLSRLEAVMQQWSPLLAKIFFTT